MIKPVRFRRLCKKADDSIHHTVREYSELARKAY